ncbi:hypothetical protein ACP275_07G117700 [Erythranthe tilingii]
MRLHRRLLCAVMAFPIGLLDLMSVERNVDSNRGTIDVLSLPISLVSLVAIGKDWICHLSLVARHSFHPWPAKIFLQVPSNFNEYQYLQQIFFFFFFFNRKWAIGDNLK